MEILESSLVERIVDEALSVLEKTGVLVLCCLRAYVVRIPLTPVFRELVYDLQHISKWAHGPIIVEPPDLPKEVQPCSKDCSNAHTR